MKNFAIFSILRNHFSKYPHQIIYSKFYFIKISNFLNFLKINLSSHAIIMNKVSRKTTLERNSSNFSYISFLGVNFVNLTFKFHFFYIINMHIKFRSNRILFTIRLINLFFKLNFKSQKLEILIFVWWNSNWILIILKFCKYEEYTKNMQPTVRFSKFTLNIIKDIWRIWKVSLRTSLERNFVP